MPRRPRASSSRSAPRRTSATSSGHAYAFFTRAGELTDRPGIIFSRAQSLRKLGGRREEAIALYEQYLATGAGTRDADAKAALAELRTPTATGDPDVDTATAKTI